MQLMGCYIFSLVFSLSIHWAQVMLKKCTGPQTVSMLKFCTKKPVQRQKVLTETIKTKAKLQDDPYAEAFGLAVGTEMSKVCLRH